MVYVTGKYDILRLHSPHESGICDFSPTQPRLVAYSAAYFGMILNLTPSGKQKVDMASGFLFDFDVGY